MDEFTTEWLEKKTGSIKRKEQKYNLNGKFIF
jgi:hypothetical protein